MSTLEALRFFGLDFYATASDIKSAYRRMAMNLRPDPATSDAATLRAAEEGMQRLNRAYTALLHRVDNTPAEDLLQDASAGAKMTMRLPKLAMPQFVVPRMTLPDFVLPKLALPALGRVSAVTVVMAAVAYGIVHGVAQKQMTPGVVDAQTVAVPQVEPVVVSKPVAEVVKPEPVQVAVPEATVVPEAVATVAEAPRRELRPPALPGLDAEDAKAITETCRAAADEAADTATSEDFRACVLRTAQATPRPIHLD